MYALSSAVLAFVAVAAAACSSGGHEAATDAVEQDVTSCTVTASRSLVITDGRVVGAAAQNAPGGAWHFSTVVDRLFSASVAPATRARVVTEAFAPPSVQNAWPLLPDGKLDIARAPFRLVAVVLRPEGTRASLGELRLIYEAYAGGALGELVSLEYAMDWRKPPPGTPANTPPPATNAEIAARRKAWIDAWRVLETTAFATPSYIAELASLTEAVTRPTEANGQVKLPALRVVAVATRGERATSWTMTALGLRDERSLAPMPLANTPTSEWNVPGFTWNAPSSGWGGSCGGWAGGACTVTDPLITLVRREEIRLYDGTFALPADLRATSIPLTAESAWGKRLWRPDGWTEERWSRARSLFSRATCDGCHGVDTGTTLHHVAPQQTGDAVLSPFVRDHELPLRSVAYRAVLCGPNALSNVTAPAAGIQVATACTTKGEVFAEPCGRGGRRYATCVELAGKLSVSERTACIESDAVE